jgi:hypothetical protein
MKKKAKSKTFLKELRSLVSALKDMKPGETHVLSVDANYGRYQIVIGPGKKAKDDERPIEIEGEIHHLFVSPDKVRTHPSKEQVFENLKDTVIMRGLQVHLEDPMGDGMHLKNGSKMDNGLRAKEYINLAGSVGERIIENFRTSDEISHDTYRIIQDDVLKALKNNRNKVFHKSR